MASRIVAPLTGSVSNGTWVAVDINVAGVTLPSGKPVHFCYMLPAQYSTNFIYPIMLWLHPDFEGTAWYQGGDSATGLCFADADGFYNNTSFRTNYPSICIVGFADQTSGNDATDNWGGWVSTGTGSGTHASGDTGPNVFGIIGVIQWVIANLSADPNRVYVNGFSLGGIGAEYLMLKYNQVNGSPKIFTSGSSTGGVLEIHGYGAGPNAADLAAMQGVPVWWVSGGNDGTSLPADWNLPAWRDLAGNSNYPAPNSSAAASQAGSSNFHFWLDPNIGHQQTNANGAPYPTNSTILNFMYSQIGGSAPTTPTVPTPTRPTTPTVPTTPTTPNPTPGTISPDGTIITTVGPAIRDANGILWTLTSGGQVAVNGVADTTTANVIEIAYFGGLIYQENASLGWWSKATPSGTWASTSAPAPTIPTAPTAPTSPTSPTPTVTPLWDAQFGTNTAWMTHGSHQGSDPFAYGFKGGGGGGFSESNGYWSDPPQDGTAQTCQISGSDLRLGCIANTGGFNNSSGGSAVCVSTIIVNFDFTGGAFFQYGYHEFALRLTNNRGFMFHFDIEDYNPWQEIDIDVWIDTSGTHHIVAKDTSAGVTFANITNMDVTVKHIYGLDWQSNWLRFYVDGVLYGSTNNNYNRPFGSYMLVDTASYDPAGDGEIQSLPAYAYLSYYRIYTTKPASPTPTRPTVPTPTSPTPTAPTPTSPTPTVPTPTSPTPTVPTPTSPTPTAPTPTSPTPTIPTVPTPVPVTPTIPTPIGTAFIPYPLATTQTQIMILGLAPSTTYDFEIIATNNLGYSVSQIITASTTAPAPTAPTVPTSPTVPTPTTPTPTPLVISPSGTQLTSTSGNIVDSNYDVWTLVSTAVPTPTSPTIPTPTIPTPTIPTPTVPTPTRPTPTIPTPTIPTPTIPTPTTPTVTPLWDAQFGTNTAWMTHGSHQGSDPFAYGFKGGGGGGFSESNGYWSDPPLDGTTQTCQMSGSDLRLGCIANTGGFTNSSGGSAVCVSTIIVNFDFTGGAFFQYGYHEFALRLTNNRGFMFHFDIEDYNPWQEIDLDVWIDTSGTHHIVAKDTSAGVTFANITNMDVTVKHIYGLDWQSSWLRFYVDGVLYGSTNNNYNRPFGSYMLVDTASYDPAGDGEIQSLPAYAYLSYYRIYTTKPTSPTSPTPTIPTSPTPTIPTSPTQPTTPTPSGSWITPTSGGSVTDASGNVWTLGSDGYLYENTNQVPNSSGTDRLTVVNGVIWARDVNSVTWYTYVNGNFISQGTATPGPSTPTAPTIPTVPTTGQFSVDAANGRIIAPNGTNWVGRGTAIRSSIVQNYVTNSACQPLTTMFPGINMVRLSAYSYFSPSAYAQQINWLTAQGIVVIIEDHMASNGATGGGAQGVVFTGQQLTNELNWYAALATQFANNTYVWFGTNNEPSQSPSLSALYTWQQQTYSAIRGTGSNAIIEMEQPNPYQQGALGGLAQNTFSAMHNIVFGPHFYSWIWKGNSSTVVSQSTIYSSTPGSANSQYGGIVQQIANIRYFSSADGNKVPVGCFEFGPSTDGSNLDVSGTNNVNAVFQAVTAGDLICCLAWIIEDSGPDNEGSASGLTSWGNSVKAQIALNR